MTSMYVIAPKVTEVPKGKCAVEYAGCNITSPDDFDLVVSDLNPMQILERRLVYCRVGTSQPRHIRAAYSCLHTITSTKTNKL
jgi:hypothetical protein